VLIRVIRGPSLILHFYNMGLSGFDMEHINSVMEHIDFIMGRIASDIEHIGFYMGHITANMGHCTGNKLLFFY